MKRKHFKWFNLTAVLILFISAILPYSASATTIQGSDLVSVSKSVNKTSLVRGTQEVADVTLTVKGTPQESTFVLPNDVILIIDKSGSMADDNRLAAAKAATKEFLDLIDTTKHRVGIVDFSASSSSHQLSSDINAAKAYVDKIQLGGGTNTGDAIRQATSMLANKRAEAQPTIVILTDGEANNTSDALASSQVAKDAGVVFYSIALLGPNEDPTLSAPNELLKNMATSADHHHFVLGSVGLSDVYRQIVEEIGLASAYNVVVTDTVSPEFEIVPGSYDNNIPRPTVNGNTLEWNITELKSNELTFTYQIRLKDTVAAGNVPLGTTSTTFEDHIGNSYSVETANPTVQVTNPAPVVSEVNANKGLTAGGETVTIKGQNFLADAKVYFGSKLATISSVSSNEIIVTAPSGTQGTTVDVKVLNSDGQFATGQYSYYDVPTITSVTPAEGEMVGGNQIAIVGTNFLKGAIVYINDKEASTYFSSSGKLTAKVPASETSGSVSVKVVNPDGTEAILTDGYTYLAPPVIQLTSLSKTSGKLAGGEAILLTGQSFDPNVKVYFGEQEVPVDYYSNSSTIRVIVPAGVTPGFITVKVENPDGAYSELVNAYEYLAPPPIQLISLSKTSGELAGGESINLYGENIDKAVKVYFGTEEAVVDYFSSSSLVRVKAPAGIAPGFVTVKIENPDGTFSELINAYEYLEPIPDPAPEITHLSVTKMNINEEQYILVHGANFQTDSKLYVGGVEVSHTFVNEGILRFKSPIFTQPTTVDVEVVNPDGQSALLVNALTYIEPVPEPSPIITSLSNNIGSINGGEIITIYGQHFHTGSTVFLGGRKATIVAVTDTEIQVTVPKVVTAGTVSVKVINPDKQEFTLSNGYTYTLPPVTISRLSITTGPVSGGSSIVIYGKNFANNMVLTIDGNQVDYTLVSTTAIRFNTPKANTTGTVQVMLTDILGNEASIDFTYN